MGFISSFLSYYHSFFSFFDQFGQPVRMNYKLGTTFQTFLGGVISSILYIIFIAITIYLFTDLEAQTNYTITTYNNKHTDPPKFELTPDDSQLNYTSKSNRGYFFFSFVFRDKLTGQTYSKEEVDKIFFIEAIDSQRNKSDGVTSNLGQFEFISCKNMYPKKNFTENYHNFLLESAHCLNNSVVTVQGDFISNFYRFLSIKFKDCSASVLKSKPQCGSKEEIENAKKNWNIILLYSDYKIDATKHDENSVTYVLSKLEVDIASLIYQKYDIYLGEFELISYNSVFNAFTQFFKVPIISVNSIVKHDSNPSKTYLALYLRSDYDYITYIRNYKNIIDLIGQVGGIWKIVAIIGAIIMVPLNTKLLNVAISNELFNLIDPDKTKDIEKQNYNNYLRRSSPSNPNKLIAAYGKNPLESRMTINYYKYERNKGMNFSVREAFFSSFLMCCKSPAIKNKEKIFNEAEERLLNRLNIYSLLNFAKQLNVMKTALLGHKKLMVEFSHKYAVHLNKLQFLQHKYKSYVDRQFYLPIDVAVLKEKYFVSGIRGMKNKVGGLDEKIDLDLIGLFNFKRKHLARYFLNHMESLEIKYPKLKEELLNKDEDEKPEITN